MQTDCQGTWTGIFESLGNRVRPGSNKEAKEGTQEEQGWGHTQLSPLQDLPLYPTYADLQHIVLPRHQEQSPLRPCWHPKHLPQPCQPKTHGRGPPPQNSTQTHQKMSFLQWRHQCSSIHEP